MLRVIILRKVETLRVILTLLRLRADGMSTWYHNLIFKPSTKNTLLSFFLLFTLFQPSRTFSCHLDRSSWIAQKENTQEETTSGFSESLVSVHFVFSVFLDCPVQKMIYYVFFWRIPARRFLVDNEAVKWQLFELGIWCSWETFKEQRWKIDQDFWTVLHFLRIHKNEKWIWMPQGYDVITTRVTVWKG